MTGNTSVSFIYLYDELYKILENSTKIKDKNKSIKNIINNITGDNLIELYNKANLNIPSDITVREESIVKYCKSIRYSFRNNHTTLNKIHLNLLYYTMV